MPDENTGQSVTKQPAEGGPDTEPINPPLPPNDPPRAAAQQVGAEANKTEIQTLKDELRTAEKWMILLTGAIAFFGLCTVVVGILQWIVMSGQLGEMKSGSADTHELAVQAKNQANRMQDFANRMKDQSDRTKELADRMRDQANQTRTIADQAVKQTHEMAESLAKTDRLIQETKNANEIATDALHASGRPWVGIERDLEISKYSFSMHEDGHSYVSYSGRITVKNFGNTPALRVGVEVDVIPIAENSTPVKSFAKDLESTKITPATQPMFVGCISYFDQYGSVHHTRFAYSVKKWGEPVILQQWPMNQTAD